MDISLISSSNPPPLTPPQPHKGKAIENELMCTLCQAILAISRIAPYMLCSALTRVCALLQAPSECEVRIADLHLLHSMYPIMLYEM